MTLGPWAVWGPKLDIGRQVLADLERHNWARQALQIRHQRLDPYGTPPVMKSPTVLTCFG